MFPQKYFPIVVCILLVVTGILYIEGLAAPFVLDDFRGIIWRSSLQDLSFIGLWRDIPNRVLSLAVFGFILKGFGPTPVPFHVFALLIHLGCSLTVCGITYKTVRRLGNDNPVFPALLAATLFALHPLQSQTVLYSWQGSTALAGLFSLLSIWFFLCSLDSKKEKAKIGYVLLSCLSMLLGGYSKPIAILVLSYLCIFVFFLRPEKKFRTYVPTLLPWVIVAVFIVLPNFFIESQELKDIRLARESGHLLQPLQYLQTQIFVIGKYLMFVVWPNGLSIDHYVLPVESLLESRFLLSAALHIFLLFSAFFARKSAPIFALGILIFYCGHVVESSILPLEDLMFEHRMYVPMFGMSLAVAGIYLAVLKRLNLANRPSVIVSSLVLVVLTASLATLTAFRIEVWKTRETLWQDAAGKAPQKRRPWTNFGMAQISEEKFEKAVETLTYAMTLPGKEDSRLYDGLGNAYVGLSDSKNAEVNFNRAIAINPNDGFAWKSFGVFLANEKRFREAVIAFQKAASFHPHDNHLQKMLAAAQQSADGSPE